jgi:hypothetical protein
MEFADDPRGANKKYREQPLLVKGKVMTVDPQKFMVWFEPPQEGSKVRIACHFRTPKMEDVQPGQEVTIRGLCDGTDQPGITDIALDECRVITDS